MSTKTSGAKAWRTIALAGMASYLDAAAIVGTSIALVLFAPTMGISEWDFGALSALLTLSFATAALIGGRLGDRFGRRRVFTATLVVFVIGVGILTFSSGLVMLYIGIFLTGIAVGADLPVSLAMANEAASENQKGKAVGLSGVLWLLGIAAVITISVFVGGMGELGGRIIYGHLLIVAIVVLILRARVDESAEWKTARTEAIAIAAGSSSETKIPKSLSQLVRPPLLAALLATGLFYAVWNIGANTIGQFSTYLYVNVAGSDVSSAALVGLVSLPVGLIAGIFFMRIVDGPSRRTWFLIGALSATAAFCVPLIFGVTFWSLAASDVLFAFGIAFAGETIYKVWTQELFPTLLRSTAQGTTIATTRYIAAAFALFTPVLALNNVTLLYIIMAACMALAGIIGLFWIPRLSRADELFDQGTDPAVDAVKNGAS